jgi:hypothetical protein
MHLIKPVNRLRLPPLSLLPFPSTPRSVFRIQLISSSHSASRMVLLSASISSTVLRVLWTSLLAFCKT